MAALIAQWANNAGTTLASSITTSATTLTVTAGGGALFPNPGTNQYFPITLTSATSSTTFEVVWCTARSTDTLTVLRAQEGTTATAFAAGDLVQELFTAGPFNALPQLAKSQTWSGTQTFSIAPVISNGVYLQWIDYGGTPRNSISLAGSSNTLTFIGGTGGVYFNNSADTVSNFYWNDSGAVTVPHTFTVSGYATLTGATSNGGITITTGGLSVTGTAEFYSQVGMLQPTGSGSPTILGQFYSYLATSGYKLFPDLSVPSGNFILNWGQVTLGNGGNQAVNFGYAFPNACLWTGCSYGAFPTSGETCGSAPISASQIGIGNYTSGTNQIWWWALGY